MSGFVEGIDRSQSTFFPPMLDDYVADDNPVRAVDAFVDGLDLGKLGFGRVVPLEQGRPGYHPATLLKIYIYGYLNRVPSSRRLERECQRNIELIWLTGQLAPDFKTIAAFRKGNGKAIREVCRAFVALCRELELFNSGASYRIDNNHRIDFHVGFGLDRNAPAYTFGIGYSFRIDQLFGAVGETKTH
jgi:transposase